MSLYKVYILANRDLTKIPKRTKIGISMNPHNRIQTLNLDKIVYRGFDDLYVYGIYETHNPRDLDAAHFEILRDPEQARKVAKSVKFDISTILDTKQETRPRGSVDYSALNSESSYLATFLFMASKGVILKVNKDG